MAHYLNNTFLKNTQQIEYFFVDNQTSCTHYLFLNWEFGNFQFKLKPSKEKKKTHTKTSNIRMFLQYMHQQTVDSQITYIWSASYLY